MKLDEVYGFFVNVYDPLAIPGGCEVSEVSSAWLSK
jgi:hypothetical protein